MPSSVKSWNICVHFAYCMNRKIKKAERLFWSFSQMQSLATFWTLLTLILMTYRVGVRSCKYWKDSLAQKWPLQSTYPLGIHLVNQTYLLNWLWLAHQIASVPVRSSAMNTLKFDFGQGGMLLRRAGRKSGCGWLELWEKWIERRLQKYPKSLVFEAASDQSTRWKAHR